MGYGVAGSGGNAYQPIEIVRTFLDKIRARIEELLTEPVKRS
ncbi:hypothetical protein EV385_2640 [Krasilnikovia cinnamomea]|uniref:Uncharacterized protein n=1 Tax=Krasilnikovia cinnamomea TaxID=349313 RepID=A0A4Q7ZJ11_9ACTN|nr:hypothetical protein [Krasilnikovia cinnamomea]RZU50848.1 hypothetical protein EV385_2640 [Krasilnikovia cinnamomea]